MGHGEDAQASAGPSSRRTSSESLVGGGHPRYVSWAGGKKIRGMD